jgi:hypothetical protein
MSRTRLTFGIILISFSAASSVSAQSVENGCIRCHQQADFYAQYPNQYAYYQRYLESPHQRAGVQCDVCHGGNASANSAQEAHVGVSPMSDKNSTLNYQQQPETCGQCHEEKQAQFVQSEHYAALIERRVAPTCTTCHPAMGGRPELRSIVLNACRNCHGEGNRDNLPQIADRAEDMFNKLNMVGGLLGWTRFYYESNEWMNNGQEYVRGLEKDYTDILNLVHQFDLHKTELAVIELLDELKEDFERARLDHEQQTD